MRDYVFPVWLMSLFGLFILTLVRWHRGRSVMSLLSSSNPVELAYSLLTYYRIPKINLVVKQHVVECLNHLNMV